MLEIVITEKTSQARDVRAAVGARYGEILPAEGHLLALEEPEQSNPTWKRWSATLLRPDGLFRTQPASGGNKGPKLKAIRAALKRVRRVWIATDCDREGQLIGQEILEHCGFRGEVKRVMFTAQDPQTIRDAFARAQPNSAYAALYAAAVARQQSDQIYNLSLTRTATVLLARGERTVIGVGRVKTPTLAIVCRRESEILEFRPQTYFEVVATAQVAGGSFRMRHAPAERILRRGDAASVAALAEGFCAPLAVSVEEKRQPPPRLHDLPSLQKLCSARFGWTAAKTLEVAQELYDGAGKKLISYPRAEARYLPESLARDVPVILGALTAGTAFGGVPMPDPPIVRRGKAGHFWDKGLEGLSHHAVIPNVRTVGELRAIWGRLSGDERRLFMVIARSYLAAFMPDYCYRQTTATLDVQGREFRAVGRQPIDSGWRLVDGDGAEAEAGRGRAAAAPGRAGEGRDGETAEAECQELPPLRGGEAVRLADARVEAKVTRPPPRYTEGTLVDAMANAWRFVEHPEHRERLKDAKGIGTPATRAEVISGLKRQDLLAARGRHVVPTERGMAVFRVLEQADRALVDPAATAKLEFLLDEVLLGRRNAAEAIEAVCGQASRIIARLLERNAAGAPVLPPAVVHPAGGRGRRASGAAGAARAKPAKRRQRGSPLG